jgi:hypothetical protein
MQDNYTVADAKNTIDISRLYKAAKRTSWRYSECKYCGQHIWFDDEILGAYGKMIPLDAGYTETPHRCQRR